MTCERCDGTGMLPFYKNGKRIPHTQVYCSCYNEMEYYPAREPAREDIDFPIAWDWHRHYESYYRRGQVECLSELEADEPEVAPIPKFSRKEQDLRDRVKGLEIQVARLRQRKPVNRPEKGILKENGRIDITEQFVKDG